MSFETQQDKQAKFSKQLCELVSELTGQKIEAGHALLAMRTSDDHMVIMTEADEADENDTIILALGVLRQVYDTQIDPEVMSYKVYCEMIVAMMGQLDEAMSQGTELAITPNPS